MKQTYSFNQRLHHHGSFSSLLKNKAISEKWVAIHRLPNSEGYDRLGIIVSKRIIAKATDRNRIKRYIREAFRIGIKANVNSWDIVVRLRKQVSQDETAEFRQTMSRLLIRVRMTDHDTPACIAHKMLSVPN